MRGHLVSPPGAVAALAFAAAGCKSDQGVAEIQFEAVAVATGDFDAFEEPLTRLDVAFTPFEGYIVRPVFDPDVDPESNHLKSEDLFTAERGEGDPEILFYDAAFVNSGTRGFGAYVYNGLDSDDSIVSDATALENVRSFVDAGRTLVVSDWAYELVEAIWPDRIDFAGNDEVLDEAQRGVTPSVAARVTDDDLSRDLDDAEQVEITYDYTYWTVIEEVSDDVTVYLEGDIEYRVSEEEGYGALEDVPLLVGFEWGGGKVLYSSFHWRAQTAAAADSILVSVVDGLGVGTSEDSGT